MSVHHLTRRLPRTAQRPDLCSCLASLSITNTRALSSTAARNATPTLHPTTRTDKSSGAEGSIPAKARGQSTNLAEPSYMKLSPAEQAARTAERDRERLQEKMQEQAGDRQLGGLADNSLFSTDDIVKTNVEDRKDSLGQLRLSQRNVNYMSLALNPRPNARASWQRKMVIRHIRHKGRLPRLMQIERTERSHLSKSHFFKTSMKKLAPLARQIAGKSIDEAILQMRFSKKKAAIDVRKQLIQARNEAIVIRGMGLPSQTSDNAEATTNSPPTPLALPNQESPSPVMTDPGITPPLPHQTPTKTTKAGNTKASTDIYIAEAWTNRGPYGRIPEPRARGRMNILRPPHTGISILLKEEKTRMREAADKETKAIRKRLGKNMWTQLPDRPVTRQSQYVLW